MYRKLGVFIGHFSFPVQFCKLGIGELPEADKSLLNCYSFQMKLFSFTCCLPLPFLFLSNFPHHQAQSQPRPSVAEDGCVSRSEISINLCLAQGSQP